MIKSYFDARSRKKAVIADNQSHTRLRSEFSEEGVRMSSIFTSDSSTHQDDGRDEVSEIEKAFTMVKNFHTDLLYNADRPVLGQLRCASWYFRRLR